MTHCGFKSLKKCSVLDAEYHHLNDFDRGCIIGMREAGLSVRHISQRVGRSVSLMVRVWSRWSESEENRRRPGVGRLEAIQGVKIELFVLLL
jgi:transposase